MSVKTTLFEVGIDKNDEMDFGVRGSIYELDPIRFNELRAMIVAGIGTMEDMWRRHQAELNPASTNEQST